jgi:tetratricopeptide (TPR) repeat protein
MRRIALYLLIAVLAVCLPLLAAIGYYFQEHSVGPSGVASSSQAQFADLQRLIALEPNRAESYSTLAAAYQLLGQFEEAEAVWMQASAANPNQAWPLVELGRLYEGNGLRAKARATFARAATLEPDDPAANQALLRSTAAAATIQAVEDFRAQQVAAEAEQIPDGEFVLLNQALPNGWNYLGYITDDKPIAAGIERPIWSFWRAPTLDTKPSLAPETWIAAGPGLWANSQVVRNELQDGGFENPLPGNPAVDFPNDIYSAAPHTRQLRSIERDGLLTTAAALINDVQNRYTSLAGLWQPIDANNAYLVSAQVYNDGGNPQLGWRWGGALPAQFQGHEYYAAPSAGDDTWRRYAGLAGPPPGAASAQFWLLNTDTEGAAYFDDVSLTQIALPAPLYPDIPDARNEQVAHWMRLRQQLLLYPQITADSGWQNAMAANGPIVAIGQTLDNGWTLQGYSADETFLARGEPTPMVVYWHGPAGAIPGTLEDGWIDLYDGSWLQVLEDTTSIVGNGTFEDGLQGWEGDIFAAPTATRLAGVAQRGEFTTTVGILTPTVEYSSTSFLSPFLPIAPDMVYLQSGWLQGAQGRGYIGYLWQGPADASGQPLEGYIAGAQAPASWSRFTQAIQPPPDASEVQVRLLNYLGAGPVAFDDITLVPIPAPAPVVTGTAATQPAATQPAATQPAATQPAATIGVAEQARDLLAAYEADADVVRDEQWLAEVAAAGPALRLDQSLDEGWTLLGITADEAALAADETAKVFFFWRGPQGSAPGQAQDGWYSIDVGTWIHIADVASLLPNGDFELMPDEIETAGFPLDYESGEPAIGRLQLADRNGATTVILELNNAENADAATPTTGVTSSVLPVDPQLLYLQTGWLHTSSGGNGVLGVFWGGEALPVGDETADFVVYGAQGDEWRQYARLLSPPDGAVSAQVTAYNLEAPGSVYLDDILLLPVVPPAALAPAVGASPSTAGTRGL